MAMAAEVAISLVIRNSLFMLSEGKILSRGLRNQINTAVNDLQNKFVTSKLLESGTDNDQQSSEGSRLLDQARGAVDIADKFLLKASQHSKSHEGRLAKIRALAHFISLWKRVRTTKTMARDLITIVKELSTHLSHTDLPNLGANASSSNARRGNVRWNGKVEWDVVGREDEARELLARLTLKDGDQHALKLRIVSVVGRENIGKTALVRSVYNRLEIDHRFQCRVWCHVTEELSVKDLFVRILKQTPQPKLKDPEHMEQKNLEEILHKSLMELRYLIVFDNLQKVEVMDDLMIILADSRNGSRVIVTTQKPEIPSLIDPWASPLKLQELDAEQSKRLLGVCGSVAEDPGLAARILSKCSGSPPRILLLGGLAAASSDSSVMVDQHADNPTLHDIVSLSYRKLPSLLKPCLLYLCLFRRDSEISTRRLFRLWLAEGLVPVLEFSAMECFKELVGRNLVHVVRCRKLSGGPKSCRMPGFLHDFFCEMATQLKLLRIHSDTKCTYHSEKSKVVNGCAWIVYHQESLQRAEIEAHQQGDNQLQYLRSYVSFKTHKLGTRSREVEELLRPLIPKGDCGLLRVLDLEGVYKPLLPDGLGNVLPNLRYLGLRWTVLDSIPESVGNMSHLETLDLKHTNVRKLPSSIWKVKSLHHLYMNEVCLDKSTSGRELSRKYLNNLQTLWGLYIGAAKSPMLNALSESTRLKKLGLTCNFLVKGVTKSILGLTMLESLKLTSRGPLGQPSNLHLSDMSEVGSLSEMYLLGGLPAAYLTFLPRKLKILTLSMSGLDVDPMPVLGKLESLEMLNLFAGSYTGQVLNCGANSFQCLRVLKLWMLEGVHEALVDETALCCLEELEIKNCGSLLDIDSLDHIVYLKQISLIKVRTELAENIKGRLTKKVFIKEKQMATKGRV